MGTLDTAVEPEKLAMRDINVAIVGCGGIANGKHMPALRRLPNVHMTAFCDIIPERAEQARKDYGAPGAKVYADYRELLKNIPDVEIVHVLTPNLYHSEISCAALKAGKHVMCEKPMAATAVEARAMVKAAEQSGKFLTIGYQTRSTASYQLARQMIKDGALGEIYYAKAPSIRRRGAPLWGVFLNKALQGGGPMIDIGTHSIDACMYLMGNYDVASVTGSVYRKLADTAMYSNEWGIWDPKDFIVEDSAMGWVKFKNGATMVVEASWLLNHAQPANMTLCGTKGGLEMRGDTVVLNGEVNGALFVNEVQANATSRELFKGEQMSAEEYEAKQWIYSVINNIPPITKPAEACVVSEIIEAIYKSAESGKTIYFE